MFAHKRKMVRNPHINMHINANDQKLNANNGFSATRGGERRNTAAYGHCISLGAFRMGVVVGVGEAGFVSWRSCARRLVDSAARRLDGPLPAHWPSGRSPEVDLRRSARSDHQPKLAARYPSGDEANPGFSVKRSSHKKSYSKKTGPRPGVATAPDMKRFFRNGFPPGNFYVGSCRIALNSTTRRHPRLGLAAGSRGPTQIHIRGLCHWAGEPRAAGHLGAESPSRRIAGPSSARKTSPRCPH